MKSNRFWLNLLNIQKQEWPIVKQLFWLQFFQGAGISFFFTAEFARFLEKFPVHELPWVMVLSAGLLWFTGFAYTVLEHHIPFRKFNEGIILFMAGTMLLVRIGSTAITDNWLYYFSLAWFYVLYLLNNLEFWGIAARLFNIRQSKRLFGVVSSGDIPAKFIGYTLALLFVPYTGTLNLLFLGVISMLLSIPFYRRIMGMLDQSHEHHASDNSIHHSHHPIKNLYQTFISSKIIRRIAIISLLASACIILINYGFYAKIKESYKNDVELARFIAMFMAGLRIIALITKTVFTSRLTTNLGVQKSLFITPFLLVGLISMIIGLSFFNSDERFIFYIFGASSIAVDVLRTAINSPVLLTIMQPLPIHERMRAHNIIKGIMDPFATLFCGLLLLLIFNIQQTIDLLTLSFTLLILAGIWLIGIVYVNREYLNMLVNTISSRYFSQEEFTLNDTETINKIKDKIKSGAEEEVLSVLSMVASKQNPVSIELLSLFLEHPSVQVKKDAIQLISQKEIHQLKPAIQQLLNESASIHLQEEAIYAISKLSHKPADLSGFLQESNNPANAAALCGMLSNKNRAVRFTAEEQVATLLRSPDEANRQYGLSILKAAADDYDHPLLALFLQTEKSAKLVEMGIYAVGKAASFETIQTCLQLFPHHEKQVKAALFRAGKQAVKPIENYFLKEQLDETQQVPLLQVLGQIGGEEARNFLGTLITKPSSNHPTLIKALYRSKFKASSANRSELEELTKAYIFYATELLFMQRGLQDTNQPSSLLYGAIQIELNEIRELLLCLFGLLYNRENIQKSKNALLANKKETIANAMEIIEVTVKKELSKYFCILFENSSIEERCNALRAIYKDSDFSKIDTVMQRILAEKPIRYHDWTTACTLYISRKYEIPVKSSNYDKFLNSKNSLLKETAAFALA